MAIRKFPMIGAHTGCSNTLDNTIESFKVGIDSGADVVEVDLTVTKDNVVVLFHDDSPLFRECTYDQLNRYDIRTQLSSIYEELDLVKLEHILEIAKLHNIRLNLDIKCVDAIEPTIELIKLFNLTDRAFITGESDGITTNHKDIQVLWNTPTYWRAVQNYAAFVQHVCTTAMMGNYYGINLHYATCRPELVEQAHALHLAVWVYTVNDPEHMSIFIDMGVNQITTREVNSLVEIKRLKLG